MKYVICVIAESRSQARIRATACLDTGPFLEYSIEALDENEVAAIEATPAATRAIADQKAVHPLIGGTYTPSVPEIHLTDVSDDIAAVIRMEITRSQLQHQITRIQQYRRRVYDWGQFHVEFQLDETAHKRMLSILETVGSEDEGTLVASVSLTDDDPEVAIALVLDRDAVDTMNELGEERSLRADETAKWRYPLPETTLDAFHDETKIAVEATSPGVVGDSPFINTAETDDRVKINP